jgi:hypothetical protein
MFHDVLHRPKSRHFAGAICTVLGAKQLQIAHNTLSLTILQSVFRHVYEKTRLARKQLHREGAGGLTK